MCVALVCIGSESPYTSHDEAQGECTWNDNSPDALFHTGSQNTLHLQLDLTILHRQRSHSHKFSSLSHTDPPHEAHLNAVGSDCERAPHIVKLGGRWVW